MTTIIAVGLLALGAGGVTGWLVRKFQGTKTVKSAESVAEKQIENAKAKAKEILLEAKDESLKVKEETKKEEQERRGRIAQLEERLAKREEAFDQKLTTLDQGKEEIEKTKQELREIRKIQEEKLQKISKLSKEDAKKVLLELTEKDMKDELLKKIKQVEQQTKEAADEKSREILSMAIQRIAAPHTAESTVSTIHLPSDEMKGRIIGREGRNIHSLERATGVDIIVDDTPETIVISAFDPIRRYIAKLSLEKLIGDGRIHPTRIEEAVEESKKKVAEMIKESGEQAVYEVGVAGLPPELIKLLGRLRFRTSYGQNVLKHSVEVAFLASMLASEIGADQNICKKAGLLHDIGKAIDHEVAGSHAIIGRDIAKKFGMPEEIVHAIEAHHEDVPFKTTEAILVQAADAISGARPGARRESLESYIKRLEELENVANSFEGVDKSFAIQAGREVRIIVKPEEIDDLAAAKLAKDIASKVEKELNYPGQVKVNVIRETRAVEYAD